MSESFIVVYTERGIRKCAPPCDTREQAANLVATLRTALDACNFKIVKRKEVTT